MTRPDICPDVDRRRIGLGARVSAFGQLPVLAGGLLVAPEHGVWLIASVVVCVIATVMATRRALRWCQALWWALTVNLGVAGAGLTTFGMFSSAPQYGLIDVALWVVIVFLPTHLVITVVAAGAARQCTTCRLRRITSSAQARSLRSASAP